MKYRVLFLMIAIPFLFACTVEPGSEGWCKTKKEQPKVEWSMDDAGIFAKHCIIDGATIGSEKWCANLKQKPKGEWTGDESKSFAKHCIL